MDDLCVRLADFNNQFWNDLMALNKIEGFSSLPFYFSKIKMQKKGLGEYILGFIGNEPCGQLFISYCPKSIYDWIRPPLIENFYVDEKFRQKGLGKKIIGFSLEHLANKGFDFASIEVEKSNFIAKKLYERLGFLPKKEYGELYFREVKFFIYMEKKL